MPGKGQIILDVQVNEVQIAAFEKRAIAAAQNIQKAMSGAFGVSGGGATGGGNGGGGSSASQAMRDEIAVLQQRKKTVDAVTRSEINQEIAVRKVKDQSAKDEIARLGEVERRQLRTAQHYKSTTAQQAAAEKEKVAAARAAEREMAAVDRARIASLKGVERIEAQRAAALRGVSSPGARTAINESFDRRVAQASVPTTANSNGFMSNFTSGFGRAGGMGSALATVIKYGAAYKAVEFAMNAVLEPARLTEEFLKRGTDSWLKYEDAMAKAERTMQQPGMKASVIKEAFRPEVLDFLAHYRTSIDDVSTAIYELGSAGASASEVMQEWQPVAKLNIALDGNMTETARTLTQMMKIHGAEMGKNLSDRQKMILLSGMIAKTWQIEQFELSDLSSAYKYVAANAATLKIKAQELIPLLGFMSTYGLRGSMGGTGLNQFLTQLGRTIKVTKDGLLEIQKTTRGGVVTVETGVKAGDVQGPVQMFAALARAAKSQPNAKWIDELSKAGQFADIFNIRGARPALLVMEKFDEFMKRVGDTSHMTAKQAEEFVQSLVDMQQNTPQAQLDIMNSKIDVAGQRFLIGAMGAGTFTDALKGINQWIDNITPKLAHFGEGIGAMFAGVSGGYQAYEALPKWRKIIGNIPFAGAPVFAWNNWTIAREANQAGATFKSTALLSRIETAGARAYLKGGRKGFASWQQANMNRLSPERPVPPMPDYRNLTPGEYLAAKDAREQVIADNKAASERMNTSQTEEWSYYANLDINKTVDLAKVLKAQDATKTSSADQLMSNFKAGLSRVPKGSTNSSKAAHEYRDAIQIVLDGIVKYEDATAVVTESLRRQEVEEQKLSRATSGRMITNANIKRSDELVAAEIKVNTDLLEALGNEQQELVREANALRAKAASAPDESTRSKTKHALSQVTQRMWRNETAIAEAKDKQDQARERGAALRITQLMQIRERESAAYVRNGRTREDVLKRDQVALDAIDRSEKIYGETLSSQVARVAVLSQQSDHLAAGRERDEARLSKTKTQYEALKSALEGMEKTGKFAPATLKGAFSESTISTLSKSKDAYGDLRDLFDKTAGEVDSLTDSVDSSTRTILDNANAVELLNKAIGSSGYAAKLEIANMAMERNRDLVESQGRDWTTSAERVQAATEIYGDALLVASQKLADLDMEMQSGTLTPEEYQKRWEEIMAAPSKAANEALNRIPLDIRHAKEALQYEMQDLVSGWDWKDERTGGKALTAIQRKVKGMREQYADNPDMLALVDSYEATAKADVMMQRWLKRREEIEQQWSQSFMQFFSELGSDSKNAVQNLFRSIIGSIQEQILNEFLKHALAGVFNQIATATTGVDPAKVAESAGSNQVAMAKQVELAAMNTLNPALAQAAILVQNLNSVLANLPGGAGASGTSNPMANVMQMLGGPSGASGGVGPWLSMLSGNSPMVSYAAGGGATAGGGFGGLGTLGMGKLGWKWAAGTNALGKVLGGASYGSISGSIVGSLLGKDPAVTSTNSAIGGAIGGAVGGPVGALIGGAIGGLFGPKKKKNTTPNREIYGMPEFEWESYIYRYAQSAKKAAASSSKYANVELDRKASKTVNININGGDPASVYTAVKGVLTEEFGNVAVANARRGSIYTP